MEAYGKRIDTKNVWDVVRKSDGRSGEGIRLCTCFGAVEDENGKSIAQELANISGKKVKASTKFFFIRQDGARITLAAISGIRMVGWSCSSRRERHDWNREEIREGER